MYTVRREEAEILDHYAASRRERNETGTSASNKHERLDTQPQNKMSYHVNLPASRWTRALMKQSLLSWLVESKRKPDTTKPSLYLVVDVSTVSRKVGTSFLGIELNPQILRVGPCDSSLGYLPFQYSLRYVAPACIRGTLRVQRESHGLRLRCIKGLPKVQRRRPKTWGAWADNPSLAASAQ